MKWKARNQTARSSDPSMAGRIMKAPATLGQHLGVETGTSEETIRPIRCAMVYGQIKIGSQYRVRAHLRVARLPHWKYRFAQTTTLNNHTQRPQSTVSSLEMFTGIRKTLLANNMGPLSSGGFVRLIVRGNGGCKDSLPIVVSATDSSSK